MSDARPCPGRNCDRELRESEFLCGRCQHRAEKALGDLAALTRELEHTTAARQDKVAAGGRGQTGKRASHPMPVNVTALDRGRTVLDLLFEWADFVAGDCGDQWPALASHRPLTDLAPQAVAMLQKRTNWLRSNEQGPDLANALHSVRRDLRRLIDTNPERLYAGPCAADLGYPPEFGYVCMLPLHRAWGAEEVTCDGYDPERGFTRPPWSRRPRPGGCGAVHQVGDRLAGFLIASVEASVLPLRLLYESLYVLVPGVDLLEWKTAHQWTRGRRQEVKYQTKTGEKTKLIVTPPRLEAAGETHDGVPLYRGRDVLELAREHAARSQTRRRQRTRRRIAS